MVNNYGSNAKWANGLERFMVTGESFYIHKGETRIALYLGNPERVLPCHIKRGENIGLLQLTIDKDPEDGFDWNPDTPGIRKQTATFLGPTHENGCPLRKLARQWGVNEERPPSRTETHHRPLPTSRGHQHDLGTKPKGRTAAPRRQ